MYKTPYIVCVVIVDVDKELNMLKPLNNHPEDVTFHRLDLVTPKNKEMCRHFKQMDTKGKRRNCRLFPEICY